MSITDCRNVMLPVMLTHIRKFLESKSEEMDLCIRILSDILELLYKEDPVSIDT